MSDTIDEEIRTLYALRQFRLITPDTIAVWANETLAAGHYSFGLDRLSQVDAGSSWVDDAIADMLTEHRITQPDITDAVSLAAIAVSWAIAVDLVDPYLGANLIAYLNSEQPSSQLQDFATSASDWEDDYDHQGDHEADIRSMAQRLAHGQMPAAVLVRAVAKAAATETPWGTIEFD